MSERELDAVIAAIEERDRLRQELAAARALLHHVLDRNVPRAQLYPRIRAALAAPGEGK